MRWWTSHAPLLLQTTSSQPVQLMHPLTSINTENICQVETITTQTVGQLYDSLDFDVHELEYDRQGDHKKHVSS